MGRGSSLSSLAPQDFSSGFPSTPPGKAVFFPKSLLCLKRLRGLSLRSPAFFRRRVSAFIHSLFLLLFLLPQSGCSLYSTPPHADNKPPLPSVLFFKTGAPKKFWKGPLPPAVLKISLSLFPAWRLVLYRRSRQRFLIPPKAFPYCFLTPAFSPQPTFLSSRGFFSRLVPVKRCFSPLYVPGCGTCPNRSSGVRRPAMFLMKGLAPQFFQSPQVIPTFFAYYEPGPGLYSM